MSSLRVYHRHSVWLNSLVILSLLLTAFLPASTMVGRASAAPAHAAPTQITQVPKQGLNAPQIARSLELGWLKMQARTLQKIQSLRSTLDYGRVSVQRTLTEFSLAIPPAALGDYVELSPFIEGHDSTTTPYVFHERTITYNYTGGPVTLSSTPDGSGNLLTDDEVLISVERPDGTEDHYYHSYRLYVPPWLAETLPVDLAYLFQPGINTVHITLTDTRIPNYWSRAYYLVSIGGPADTIPPTISEVTWRQDGKGSTIVMATVTDNVSVAAVALWWNGDPYPMQLMGPDRYYAIVSGQPNGTIGSFYITAVDPSGNLAVWPSSGTQEERIGFLLWAGLHANTRLLGEPVNTATGNFYTQHQDVFAPGPGMDFEFARVYNAIAGYLDGPLGYGWTHSYNTYLEVVNDPLLNGVVLTYPDGHIENFAAAGGGFESPDGVHDILESEGAGFVLTKPDQIKYHYDDNGKLTSIEDRNSNEITFTYSGDDLTQITDAAGRGYTLEYTNNHVTRITDVLARTYEYSYDEDGNLVQYKDPEGGLLSYAYTPEHWLLSITDPNGHTFVANTYDSRGRVIQQVDASGSVATFYYVDEYHVISTDYAGNPTEHFYDDSLRIVQEKDALGRSATYEYDDDNNVTQIVDGGGHVTRYSYDDRGNVLSKTDALGQVAEFQYDIQNDLLYQHDEAGAETHFEYTAPGNLTHIIDAEGGDTWMTYDGRGLRLSQTDSNGNQTQYSYDSQGNLTASIDPLGGQTLYTYDLMGRQMTMEDANGHTLQYAYDGNDRRVSVTDPKGNTTYFNYDGVGNLLKVTDRRGFETLYEYNENDLLIKETDALGNSSLYTYDQMYHRLSAQNKRGFTTAFGYDAVYNQTSQTDPKGYVTVFTYNADNLLASQVDALGQTTLMEYDALHRVTKVTDALGGTTVNTYDPAGRLLTVKDPKGGVTQYEYDKLGRRLKLTDGLGNITAYAYDPAGNMTSMTNARGNTTQYDYDVNNQLIEQINPLGYTTTVAYDGVGNVITRIDARGNTSHYEFDQNDNLVRATDPLGGVVTYSYDEENNQLSQTDQNGNTTSFSYDGLGHVNSVALPLGQTTTRAYDENGNLISETNAKGSITYYAYDEVDLLKIKTTALGFATKYDYDALRRMVQMTDAENNATGYSYDALGRLVGVTDALGGQTTYGYDPLGNLISYTDANGHTTGFEVDLLGRVTKETNPLGKSWSYQYDPLGNRGQRQDANGVVTDYTFDAADRPVHVGYPSGPAIDYAYDENNNLTSVIDSSGSSAFTYDALDRLTQASRPSGILMGASLGFAYDPVGNRTQITYPNGKTVQYAYNANNWLHSVLDPRGGLTTYSYDAVGLPLLQQNPNTTRTEYAYDADDRLISLLNAGSTALISSFDFSLDKVGNQVETIEKVVKGSVITWDKKYTYDPLYRLTSSVFTPDYNPAQPLLSTFTYDAVGNRLSMKTNIADKPNTPALPKPITTSYTYNAANQMLGAGATFFTYDPNGNRISMSGKTRKIEYKYDYENRLSRAKTYSVSKGVPKYDSTMDYSYNALGQRLERGVVEKGVRKIAKFLYDGQGYDLLGQYVTPGQTIFYYRDLHQVLSRQEQQDTGDGLWYYYHYDALGSVSAWTNNDGSEVQEYMYAPYGRLIDNNGPDNTSSKTQPLNQLTFSGKPWDRETEDYYFGARDYDPTTGVWLTQDTFRGDYKIPASLHRYSYVGNNPITLIDYYGYSWFGNVWATIDASVQIMINESVTGLPETNAQRDARYAREQWMGERELQRKLERRASEELDRLQQVTSAQGLAKRWLTQGYAYGSSYNKYIALEAERLQILSYLTWLEKTYSGSIATNQRLAVGEVRLSELNRDLMTQAQGGLKFWDAYVEYTMRYAQYLPLAGGMVMAPFTGGASIPAGYAGYKTVSKFQTGAEVSLAFVGWAQYATGHTDLNQASKLSINAVSALANDLVGESLFRNRVPGRYPYEVITVWTGAHARRYYSEFMVDQTFEMVADRINEIIP